MPEFEKQVGASVGEPVNYDIGWYLSACLEDPHESEEFKNAIKAYFEGRDGQSRRYRNLISDLQSDIEKVLETNKRLQGLMQEVQTSSTLVYEANKKLCAKIDKLEARNLNLALACTAIAGAAILSFLI